ncbi:MAG: glycosyltransferase family 4 protein [Candidatus Moraniibacteriota bacterium]
MKIAFIGQKGIPTRSGGVEKHVEKLSVRLVQTGHEVTVYTRPNYTPATLESFRGVRLISLPSIPTKHLDAITHTLLATIHALFQDYDVIHYHSIGPSIVSILPRVLKPRTRVVSTFHSRDYFHKKWGSFARNFLKAAEFFTCKVPERTIAVSQELAQYAKDFYHCDAVYIPNGAEVEMEASAETLLEWGLRPGRYVLSVSRLVGHKGIHFLIKAFMELEDTNKLPNNYKLVIAGAPASTTEYEKYLRTMAAGRKNILFVGEQQGKRLAALFTHAGLFVQPSENEGMSMALLEAMAYGLPVVVSDIEPNLEVVRGGYGAVFPVRDVDALKQEMAHYINRPDEAKRLGELARTRIDDAFSWDAIARQTAGVYQETIDARANSYHWTTKHVA